MYLGSLNCVYHKVGHPSFCNFMANSGTYWHLIIKLCQYIKISNINVTKNVCQKGKKEGYCWILSLIHLLMLIWCTQNHARKYPSLNASFTFKKKTHVLEEFWHHLLSVEFYHWILLARFQQSEYENSQILVMFLNIQYH